jgi:hypothetical protein
MCAWLEARRSARAGEGVVDELVERSAVVRPADLAGTYPAVPVAALVTDAVRVGGSSTMPVFASPSPSRVIALAVVQRQWTTGGTWGTIR